jgi:hypothetical protein
MKFIDADGKLFGKFNIIDSIILLFIIFIVVFGIIYIFFNKEDIETTIVQLKFINQPDYIHENIHIGDILIEKNNDNRKNNNSKIIELTIFPSIANLKNRDILMLAELAAKKNYKGLLFFDNQEIKIGAPFELNTPFITGSWAKIIEINGSREEITFETKKVQLEVDNIPDYMYNKLNVGDNIFIVNNETNSKIIDIEVISEYKESREILVLAEIETFNRENKDLFENQEIKIGNYIKFRTDSVSDIWGKIIGIDEFIEPYIYGKKIVIVKSECVDPKISNKIKIGTRELLNNKIIAVVNQVTVAPQKIISVTDNGEVLVRENPLKNEVIIEVELEARKIEEDFTYKNQIIDAGKKISFDFEELDFEGLIIAIE